MNRTITRTYQPVSPQETEAVAASLAQQVGPGAVIALYGPLGTGKTVFVRGFAAACSVKGLVTSPTYTLVQHYDATPPLLHIDLYRIQSSDEMLDLGLDACRTSAAITLIEWAEHAADLLPDHTVHVRFSHGQQPQSRIIEIQASASTLAGLA